MMEPDGRSSRFIASLGVRPARVAVLVPRLKPLSHLALFEAALAAQARTWGGHGNLVFPLTPDMTQQDLFWALAELFDPDTFVVYSPTYEDASEIRSGSWRQQRRRADQATGNPHNFQRETRTRDARRAQA